MFAIGIILKGGWYDFKDSFDTVEEATSWLLSTPPRIESFAQIIDSKTGRYVEEYECDYEGWEIMDE